jgi:F-type H+-transporting ATPase subunit epsilon
MKFRVRIISVEKELYSGEAQELKLPAAEGGMSVLANHAPTLSPLKKGTVLLITDSREKKFEIEAGFADINENGATVMVR